MSYVDGIIDRDRDVIEIVERVNGKRIYKQIPARYVLYYPDAKGKFKSIWNEPLSRIACTNGKTFAREKKLYSHKKLYESDMNPVFRCLAENYLDADAPALNIAFFDIETDFNKALGFAPPEDPFNAVTAVAVHLSWLNRTICLAVAPNGIDTDTSKAICDKFPDTMLMNDEKELLGTFLDLIDDADVITGWNSEGFDIPYMVNRVKRELGKEYTRKFCLWNKYPKRREYLSYGKTQETFDTVGRVHLDMLQLYRKYTYHEMHSYSLDAIAEYELGDKKTEYEGTLDQLYNNDFEKFIGYNRQDVDLLVKLEAKLQFIDLANVIAHDNTVLLQTTMGAVAQTDQAIVNAAHARGMQVPDKSKHEGNTQAAGAYVATPVKGMHEWLASMDLNSLYPSILRAGNMSTETIVGQVRHVFTREMLDDFKTVSEAWEGKFACPEYELVMDKDRDTMLYLDFEDGTTLEATGAEIYDLVFLSGQPWIFSANGTIFRHDTKGVIPGLLEQWYAERKILQKNAKEQQGVDADKFAFWDKRQLVKKINLNSLYGALLNPGCRFFDQRLGQSTTLTGRCIARHMAAEVNRVIEGTYDHMGKSIIYGDTDSVYFSAYPILKPQIDSGELEWTKDKVTEYYEAVCDAANVTFPGYMNKAHNCPSEFGEIIAAAREIVGVSGIFIKKKRYAILVYDNEGYREDTDGKPGKVKAMGLDLKRSDTPVFMQDFLKEILEMVLTGGQEQSVLERIKEFRKPFREKPGWEKGTPKRVNNLTNHTAKYDKTGKCGVGHALAAINYNRLRKMNSDAYSMEITDGMKTIVCKLKPNPMGFTSIGYPTDSITPPEWFKELPFDVDLMEETIITKKIDNLLGVLPIDLSKAEDKTTFESLFDFG